jgi:hypothetical protein
MDALRWLAVLWLASLGGAACGASGASSASSGAGAGAGAPGGQGGTGGTPVGHGGSVTVGTGGAGGDACARAASEQASHGCELWAVKPDVDAFPPGWCFAAVLVNGTDGPVRIAVSRVGIPFTDTSFIRIPQGQGELLSYGPYDPVGGLPPGEVAIAFLSHYSPGTYTPHCPAPAAVDADDGVRGTGRGDAFLIETDRPVTAYSFFPYGGGSGTGHSSASLLLAASAWDTNYLAVNPYAMSELTTVVPSLAILAREHGTEVTILPKVAIEGGAGVDPSPASTPVTYHLYAGEYLQLSQAAELTGSAIQANKPIGVWGSSAWFTVPVDVGAGDGAHQQIPPVRALGHRYVGVRYRNRLAATSEEAPPWRLVGAVDGTTLSWTPAAPPGAPTALSEGEVAEFFAPGPLVVESQDEQHSFYFAQYMTGATYIDPDPNAFEGDAEWLNVIPTAQYLARYIFFTDPTYPETNLVVVRARSRDTQEYTDVVLDCAGPLSGWEPVGDDYQYTRLDLSTGDYQPVGSCDNGRHEITSDAPFSVTVWGWGGYSRLPSESVSYGYPAGASVGSINDIEVPATPR